MTTRSIRRQVVITGAGLATFSLLLGLAAPSANAARVQRYALTAKSQFQSGCFPPCLCPLGAEEPLRGRFLLVHLQNGPLFDTFAVRQVKWTTAGASAASPVHKITGRGTYLLGGEVAVTQRLELDLSIDGGPPQHFDSGFVVAQARFPEITATVSMNDMVCFDEVFSIDAVPASAITAPR